LAVSGWECREAAAENMKSIEVLMPVCGRRVRDNPPYHEAEMQRSRGDREPERQNSKGAP